MGRVEGKVALITGAARGQGRSHAVRLAEEGASVIAIDACAPNGNLSYQMPTLADMADTVRAVEAVNGRIVARQADVRDKAALGSTVADGVDELGPIDVICANHGIFRQAPLSEVTAEAWAEVIDTNLTGVLNAVQACLPSMLEADRGGSIIITSSSAGLKGFPKATAYSAAKHGVVGMMRVWANELGSASIRVNTIHPSGVPTPMLLNDAIFKDFRPDLENPTVEDAVPSFSAMHLLPTPWLEEIDISNAVLFLASDEARYVTGQTLSVDAGFNVKV